MVGKGADVNKRVVGVCGVAKTFRSLGQRFSTKNLFGIDW